MLNHNASLQEQAFQAVQLKNELMVSARNAMDDANAAAQLSMTTPTRTFDELLRARASEGYSGNALYNKVIDDAATDMQGLRKVSMPGGCFVAGTLVHTKEGLVPIENIKIGDWVLSQPEETGEQTYKRVVRTLQFADKEVWSIEIFPKVELDQARLEGRMIDEGTVSRLVVTGNHPFWVKGKGWTRADQLGEREFPSGEYLQVVMANGQPAVVSRVDPIKRTLTKGIGWIQRLGNSDVGDIIDLQNGASAEFDFRYKGPGDRGDPNEGVNWWEPENAHSCTVYNMEVEDFHTYYVGTLGIWAHNTNCDANLGEMDVYVKHGIIPQIKGTLPFQKKKEPRAQALLFAIHPSTRRYRLKQRTNRRIKRIDGSGSRSWHGKNPALHAAAAPALATGRPPSDPVWLFADV